MPADEGPSLARTRTVPCSMMSRLRDDSQRTAAESTRAPRLALEQQQELEPKTLEQQLKDNARAPGGFPLVHCLVILAACAAPGSLNWI